MGIRASSSPSARAISACGRVVGTTVAIATLSGGALAQGSSGSTSNSPSPQSTATPAAGSASTNASASAPVWLLVPIELSSRSEQVANGCWVRLYSRDDFQGRTMTVLGPANLAEVASPYGTGLDNWESAVVGPNATVTTYDDENFRARDATLRAGQRYARLDDSKLGLFEDIESMRVNCAPGRGSAGASGVGNDSRATSGTATSGSGAMRSTNSPAAVSSSGGNDPAQGSAATSGPTSDTRSGRSEQEGNQATGSATSSEQPDTSAVRSTTPGEATATTPPSTGPGANPEPAPGPTASPDAPPASR